MPRLIDADALKRYIDGEISMSREEREDADAKDDALGMAHNNGEIHEARRIKRYIEKHAPTIEAEPVVRCKECTESEDGLGLPEGILYCNVWDTCTTSDGYCHHGKKSEPCHRPEDCVNYATRQRDGRAVCLGTRELDPCDGAGCKRWKAKKNGGTEDED